MFEWALLQRGRRKLGLISRAKPQVVNLVMGGEKKKKKFVLSLKELDKETSGSEVQRPAISIPRPVLGLDDTWT